MSTMYLKKTYSIGEVASILETNTHVIRNWVEKFSHIKKKIEITAGSRRNFNEDAIDELKKIQKLINKYGMSIEGIKTLIKNNQIKPELIEKDFPSTIGKTQSGSGEQEREYLYKIDKDLEVLKIENETLKEEIKKLSKEIALKNSKQEEVSIALLSEKTEKFSAMETEIKTLKTLIEEGKNQINSLKLQMENAESELRLAEEENVVMKKSFGEDIQRIKSEL